VFTVEQRDALPFVVLNDATLIALTQITTEFDDT
jgi:hypothetical protein